MQLEPKSDQSEPELGFIHHYEEPTADAFSADNPAPAVLLLHGTGGDELDLLPLGRAVAPRAALLSPRGKVLEQGMPRFFRRVALGIFDEEDLRLRAAELVRFLSAAREHYSISDRPLYALGYSNGANMAATLLLLYPEVLSGAILLRATMPLEPDAAPSLKGKPILIAQGRVDPYVPPAQGQALERSLRAAEASVEALRVAEGHALEEAEMPLIAAWAGTHIV